MNYSVGHNEPGYLPEAPVDVVDSFETAKEFTMEAMNVISNYSDDYPDDQAELAAAIENVKTWDETDRISGRISITAANMEFWIADTDEPTDEQADAIREFELPIDPADTPIEDYEWRKYRAERDMEMHRPAFWLGYGTARTDEPRMADILWCQSCQMRPDNSAHRSVHVWTD